MCTTLSHLTVNLTMFIEPIVFTFALTLLNYNNEEILYKYSEINAYVLPTLTILSFISFQISTSLFPIISNNYQKGNKKYIEKLLSSIILMILFFSIFVSNIFYNYPVEITSLLYGENIGINNIKILTFFFILSYISPIFITLFQATNNHNFILKTQIILSIIKIISIFIFSFVPQISENSLVVALILNIMLTFIIYFIKANKIIKIKIPVLKLIFAFLFCFVLGFVLNSLLNIYFIFNILIYMVIYFVVIILLSK